MSPTGTFAWVADVGAHTNVTSSHPYADTSGIATLPDGSAVITGAYLGTASFGTTQLVSSSGGGAASAFPNTFVAKVSPTGGFVWATTAGAAKTPNWIIPYTYSDAVATYADGSSVIVGYFDGQASFGGFTLTSHLDGSTGITDGYIAKLNANGTYAWVQDIASAGSNGSTRPYGVAAFAGGSAVLTGVFGAGGGGSDTATFGTLAPLAAQSGAGDAFTAQLLAAPVGLGSITAGGLNAGITVTWPLPGPGVASVRATVVPGGHWCVAAPPRRSCTIVGLAPTAAYTVSVTPTNAIGSGPASAINVPAITSTGIRTSNLGAFSLAVACRGVCRGAVAVRYGRVIVGSAAFSRAGVVVVHLNATGRALLRRARAHTIAVTVTVSQTAAGYRLQVVAIRGN